MGLVVSPDIAMFVSATMSRRLFRDVPGVVEHDRTGRAERNSMAASVSG